MKLIIFSIVFATFCKLNFSFSIRNDFTSFQNYRNVLAYILNQTKSIDGMILDEVENLIVYAEHPDDYVQTVGDHLIKSLFNEPQAPYFDEFGTEFQQLTCQEIKEELEILFKVSKYFLMKAVRNEESIKMLKTLVRDLAKFEYDNFVVISNIIDAIADNYAAQNHVFTMIENLDDEIQIEIEKVAKHCRQEDYKAIEEVEQPIEDVLMNYLMDNGQNLLDLIEAKRNKVLNTPELLIFEDDVETEDIATDNLDSKAKVAQDLDPFEQYEYQEDSSGNKSVEYIAPIVINLIIEPESPDADEKGSLTENEEILNLLLENPKAVELLLEEIVKPEAYDEAGDESEFNKNEQNQLIPDFTNDDWNEDSGTKNSNLVDSKFNAEESKNINVKGIIVKVPYQEDETVKTVQSLEENSEIEQRNIENPGIVPEAENFRVIFPIRDEDQIERFDDKKSGETIENEDTMMLEPENFSLKTDRESDSDELLSVENLQNKKAKNIILNSDDNYPQNEDSNSKEFIDFVPEDFNQDIDNSEVNSNFDNFLKVPENFWEVPLGFWKSFQNFIQNFSNDLPENANSVNFNQDLNETEFTANEKEENSGDDLENFEGIDVKSFKNGQPENEFSNNLTKNEETNTIEKLKENFEEGIEGIDKEIVLEIKKNEANSVNDDTKNSVITKNLEFNENTENELKEIDKNSGLILKTLDDERNSDFAAIDSEIEESEFKEDNFVPQFSEDKNRDVEDFEMRIKSDKKESVDDEDSFDIPESENSHNNSESLKIQNLPNHEENEILEQQMQLMLELQEGEEDPENKEIDDTYSILSDFDLSNEFEGEILDDEIKNNQVINKISKEESDDSSEKKFKQQKVLTKENV